jgi:NTE family protein
LCRECPLFGVKPGGTNPSVGKPLGMPGVQGKHEGRANDICTFKAGGIMYGLVLEGGGGRGAYQIGACKAIEEMGFEISMVAGTSVGALNGAMVVQGEIEKAYEIWYDLNPQTIIKFTKDELSGYSDSGFSPEALRVFVKRLKRIISEGGLNVEPLENLVKSVLDEDRIRKSPIGFGVVTVDLTRRRAMEIYKEDIPYGYLADYVIASASFPVFKRTIINGRAFIDGALYNSLPINMVSSLGYKDIIVLRTYGIGMKRRIDTRGLNIISISPSENLGFTLDFSNKTARRNLRLGYNDAVKALEKYA